MSLPRPVISCLGGLLHYLSEFKLDRVLGLTSNFWRFSSPSHMMLDATTLINLEVLQNQNDQTEQGSLLWLLKQTKTAFGSRLLRHWITHPLLHKDRILARHDAVEELLEDPPAIEPLAKHLKGIPDLERALARLHYSKCSPNELVAVLRAFIKVGELAKAAKKEADSLKSALLVWLVRGMPEPSSKLEGFLNEMNLAAATATGSNGKAEPDTRNLLRGYKSKSQYPSIFALKEGVVDVEGRLQEHLVECRRLLGMRDLEYKTVLKDSLLLEVPNDKQAKVPKSWLKINGTKAASRYHSPEIQELQQELLRLHERLDAQTSVAWQQFQEQVAECYGELHAVVQRLAVLDCLLSLADVSKTGGWCRPTLHDEHQLRIVGGRHPMVDALMGGGYVPNDVDLSHSGQVGMVITGPNMGGKSSYMRKTALLVIMAQVITPPLSPCSAGVRRGMRPDAPPRTTRRWGASCPLTKCTWGSLTTSSRAWAPRTSSRKGAAPSWSSSRRPRISSCAQRHARSSSWMSSGAGPARTMEPPLPTPPSARSSRMSLHSLCSSHIISSSASFRPSCPPR